jgi:hypothetical protein
VEPIAHPAFDHPDLGFAVYNLDDALSEKGVEEPPNLIRLGDTGLIISCCLRDIEIVCRRWRDPARLSAWEDKSDNRGSFIYKVTTPFSSTVAACVIRMRLSARKRPLTVVIE